MTEAENWDLLADCTSQDGGEILDAGVHLSDKCTMSLGFTNIAKEDTQTVSNTVQHIYIFYPNPLLLYQMVKKQIILFLKCFQLCLAFSPTARV